VGFLGVEGQVTAAAAAAAATAAAFLIPRNRQTKSCLLSFLFPSSSSSSSATVFFFFFVVWCERRVVDFCFGQVGRLVGWLDGWMDGRKTPDGQVGDWPTSGLEIEWRDPLSRVESGECTGWLVLLAVVTTLQSNVRSKVPSPREDRTPPNVQQR